MRKKDAEWGYVATPTGQDCFTDHIIYSAIHQLLKTSCEDEGTKSRYVYRKRFIKGLQPWARTSMSRPAHSYTMPLCGECAGHFVNTDALEQHLRNSTAHARQSNRLSEETPKISQVSSTQEGRDSPLAVVGELVSGIRMLQISLSSEGPSYIGVAPSLVKPVFRVACSLRRNNPSVQLIREKSRGHSSAHPCR
jgi:hypothetical protein